jgi:hypothetical protein
MITKHVYKHRIAYTNERNEIHRLDGPAIIYPSGTEEWYKNNYLHRLDGPAIKRPDGTEEWRINGTRHREDGPTSIFPFPINGSKYEWRLFDHWYPKTEHNRLVILHRLYGNFINNEYYQFLTMEVNDE